MIGDQMSPEQTPQNFLVQPEQPMQADPQMRSTFQMPTWSTIANKAPNVSTPAKICGKQT